MAERLCNVKAEIIAGMFLYVWCDDDMLGEIAKIHGVTLITKRDAFDNHRTVWYDKRYSIHAIAREINALDSWKKKHSCY
jgi:hypothetical protein